MLVGLYLGYGFSCGMGLGVMLVVMGMGGIAIRDFEPRFSGVLILF